MTTRRSVLRTLAGLPLLAGATDTLLASLLRTDERIEGIHVDLPVGPRG